MREFRINLNGLTVGMLKKIISDIPDDCEITVWNSGETGFIDKSELEIITYENLNPDININVKAESGYY
jgi:hypothetical protein